MAPGGPDVLGARRMSFWQTIVSIAHRLFLEGPDRADPAGDADFAASVVALAAKMARADGRTTRDEAAAFRAAFPMRPAEAAVMTRLFELAQQTVHGFDGYARRIARRYAHMPELRADVLDILHLVAAADGAITPEEEAYLEAVGGLLGLDAAHRAAIAAPYFPDRTPDPFAILGVRPDADDAAVRAAWLAAVSASHPDRFLARGAPPEFVRTAERKAAAANAAYGAIRDARRAARAGARSQSRVKDAAVP